MSRSTPHVVAAASLTAASALMVVTAVADPMLEQGPDLAAQARGTSTAIVAAGLATVALAVLLAVGTAALLLVVRGRGRRLVLAAALVTVAGAPGFVLDAGVELAVLDLARSDADDTVVASTAAVLDAGTVETLAFVGILLAWAGLLLLPLALWRARLVPPALAALLLLAAFVEPAAHRVMTAHVVAHVVLLAGYALVAQRLLQAAATVPDRGAPTVSAAPSPPHGRAVSPRQGGIGGSRGSLRPR
jgi:hypothetical protein